MQTIKRFIAIFIVTLLTVPVAPAQDQQRATPTNKAISQDVQIVIQQQQVSFAARLAVEQMQLQISNQAGETIFDSGAVAGQEIIWPLQQASGEALKSGLYAYTFTFKETGAAEARVRRGHFIVDRAKDRDGQTDRLWITSRNEDGVGAELTVARNDDAVIAGTGAPSKQGTGKERDGEGDEKDKGEKKNERAALEVSGTGAPGQIAKFISEEEIGNSEIAEVEGNVGIGTTAPVSKLDVRGHFTLDAGGSPVLFTASDGGEQNRYLQLINSPAHRSASGLKAGGILVSDSYAFANPGKNDLVVKGNVGIGTTASSVSRLTVEGQDALWLRGFEPFLTLQDSNSTLLRDQHRIQSAHGDLNFFHGFRNFGGISLYTYVPRMVIKDTGNVGIGTAFPNHQLSLGRGPTWTRNGWGGSVELENATAIAWKTNAAGNRFGIGHTNGGLYFFRTASDPGTAGAPAVYDMSISDTGVVSLGVLQITGGADFAENFEVNAAPESGEASPAKIEPGLVVSIDPANPGKLALTAQAYDRRVAGIISGAGGVKPGMVMSQEGTLAHGQHPVALSGRVYCWADASNGPIKPGDLLTTSDTPGHAMKAADRTQSQGAIIGKAMTSLKEGKGLVLVLVTLQ